MLKNEDYVLPTCCPVWILRQRCAFPLSSPCAEVVDPELQTSDSNLLHRSHQDHYALLTSGHRRCRDGNIYAAHGTRHCRKVSDEYRAAIDGDILETSQVKEFEADFSWHEPDVAEVKLQVDVVRAHALAAAKLPSI
jgi:hypothetical protein